MRPEPPRPARFRVENGGRRVSWRWLSWQAIVHLAFGGLFCVPGWRSLHSSGLDQNAGGLLFGAVGLFFVYVGVARLVNRTAFDITADTLVVSVGPLPWPGTGTWTSAGTRQLFVAKTTYQINYRHLYRLMAVGRDGVATQIGHAVSDSAAVRWLDWWIEGHLGIEHDPRMDEVGPYEG